MNTSAAVTPISFGDLYVRYSPRIYRRILSLVKNQQTAEDLTQEAFVKAWRAWPPASHTNLSGWLYRIATRTALDALRRDHPVCWLSLDAASWMVDESTTDPQTHYEGASGQLEAALSHLPACQRTLLLLPADYTASELAQMLGVNRCALASQLSRLKARAARLHAQVVSA